MDEQKNNALEKAESREIDRDRNRKVKKKAKMLRKKRLEEERARQIALRNNERAERENARLIRDAEKMRLLEEQAIERREINQAEARIREEKLRAKEQLKREKHRDRQKNKEQGRSNGGWLAAVITLSIATIVLASILTATYIMPTQADTVMESAYRRNFYDAVEQVDNIDLNLSKLLATSDSGAMQTYLVNVAIQSELAENDIQSLPLKDENKYYTTKLVNQIGDYSKYLNKKLINGQTLSEEDRNVLYNLYIANRTLKESLYDTLDEMGNDFSFSTMNSGGNGNVVIKGFNELQNLSVEYPELIYDGPFSDGQNEREVKGLSGEEVSEARALEIFNALFYGRGLEDVMSRGETDGNIPCYSISGLLKGDELYAQISKKGGRLVMFAYSGSCKSVEHTEDYAIESALEFLTLAGYTDMKPVWINLSNNLYTINFAYEIQGVIIYSDLVKVRVCAETGMVIGLEATSYLYNHTERVLESPSLTKASAVKCVSSNIEVESGRLCVVPIGTSTEKLCYEFSGEYDGALYYVYIDAINGKQVEMFKVIESTEGKLLM